MRLIKFVSLLVFFNVQSAFAFEFDKVKVAAERIDEYLPLIEGKRVAIIANHTSFVYNTHLVDTLFNLGIDIKKIFAPEHGFRGLEDAGGIIKNDVDLKTNLPVISLYGKNKKPSSKQLENVDIVIFDIQDVGVRFYTYISTMHLAMEACAENNTKFLVLDRPNPNGFYIDGPILDPEYKSFIGMHPIPIVHGLTVAELALMINGEKWLKDGITCDLTYVLCEDYSHKKIYKLPIKPSPNLPNMASVLYYPTLGLLEGSSLSVGRGTEKPFQFVGHPEFVNGDTLFTPESRSGAKFPKWEDKECKGYDINNKGVEYIIKKKGIDLGFILEAYSNTPKDGFFRSSFNKLAGNKELQIQIQSLEQKVTIRAQWTKGLQEYKNKRKTYLLYGDFE